MILLTLKALSSYLPVQEVVDLNELSSLKTRFPSVSSQHVQLVSEEHHNVRQEIRLRAAWKRLRQRSRTGLGAHQTVATGAIRASASLVFQW